jgi:pimeloyl-ACP methyl ester carboxylesterase
MADFTDAYWTSADGLRLHYRDYAGRSDRPVVVCLPGLTRNARDFEGLAGRLAGDWRVVCPDLRGRGDSAYARDCETYVPGQYLDDLGLLLAEPGFERIVLVGTSLGGILTMILTAKLGARVAGAVLNDIGPVVEASGLDRIRGYVGQGRSFPTWMHAARALEETHGPDFPDYAIADWLRHAKRTMVLSSNGRVVFDYDMKIAEPFATTQGVAPPDLWSAYETLAGRPLLIVRGALSDILTGETLAEMLRRIPDAEALTIDRIGHPPTLDEPDVAAAIDRLLAKVG